MAENGRGLVSPNPMVGAVVVCDNKIIGEGYHIAYGEPHAEVNAIASVKDQNMLQHSTLYVNLEPCSHHGKTPPCADLIIRKKIPRVVIGQQDPYLQVAGRGIGMLKAAGVDVVCGVLEDACRELNKRFICYHTQQRPYIILKWAQSADGFMDKKRIMGDGQLPVIFSDEFSRMRVHKLRAEEDAIMVGTRTALLDNPSLNVRYWSGKNPLRIAIDRQGEIPRKHKLRSTKDNTLIFTENKNMKSAPYVLLDSETNVLEQVLETIYQKKILSLIVEGGSKLLNSFINADLWDEANIEISPICLEDGILAPCIRGKRIMSDTRGKAAFDIYKNRYNTLKKYNY
ncbi:riboflavin biosynthesis protein RibD [Bacteroidales bacterium]|nr:riboflavin biosynthesis protein RibD [Bacteroidales bacterium]